MNDNAFETVRAMLERHDNYVRHIFAILVSWSAFFFTLNWATLGWVAHEYDDNWEFGKIGSIVGVDDVLAWHCILSITICAACVVYFWWASNRIASLEAELNSASEVARSAGPAFPALLYIGSSVLIILGVVPFVYIWLNL